MAKKIVEKIHVSTRTLRNEIAPFLKIIYENDKDMAKKIYRSLGLTREEFEIIIGK